MADAFQTMVGRAFPPVGIPAFSNFVLNQSTDALEFVFQAQEAITITRLGFRQGVVTGTSPVYRVSLEGVTSGGLPDGTIKSSGDAYADFTPVSGDDSTWKWYNLTSSYACSRGETLAVVIKRQSGTIDASNNCSFGSNVSNWGGGSPKSTNNDNGSRTVNSGAAPFSYGSSTRAYGRPIHDITTVGLVASTSDEAGWKIEFPAGWGDSFKISGVVMTVQSGTSDGTITLYDSSDTILQQTTVNGSIFRSAGGTFNYYTFDTATLATLSFGSVYRLTISFAANRSLNYVEVASNADIQAWPMGEYLSWTERSNAGSWTDRGNRRLQGEIILADITEPTGGGGGYFVAPAPGRIL
jgi:hypothetical protein